MSAHGLDPWRPAASDWNRAAVAHLYRRAGFGPAPGEVERALEDGFEATVEHLIEGEPHDRDLLRGVESLLAAGEIEHLQAWWMALVLDGRARLVERTALVWHDHFATSYDKVGDVRTMHAQNRLFRERGLGDFRELLRAIAVDPAMLAWLDGNENVRGNPNENFARELLELFALGIGHYGERDVQEAARAFTGHGTDGRSHRYREADHDPGEKTVLGHTGHFGAEDAIELVLAHPTCARHVARALLAAFACPDPSDASVGEAARRLVDSGWSVKALVRDVLRSELFFGPACRRARIAGPVELVALTARALGARVAPLQAAQAAADMGQALFRPPSVKGWDGGRAWIDAGTWVARHDGLLLGVERADLGESLGRPRSAREAAELAVRTLVPDLEGSRFAGELAAACDGTGNGRALELAAQLIVTAPEYQLV